MQQAKGALRPLPLVLSLLAALALPVGCVSGGNGTGTNHNESNGGGPGAGGVDAGGQGSGASAAGGQLSTADNDPKVLPAAKACTAPGTPGPRVLRRLTAAEFAASIPDVFGDKSAPVAAVFNDRLVLDSPTYAPSLIVSGSNADQLMSNAEGLASWAVSNKLAQLTQLATCSTHDENCAKLFIKNFGRKAFRATLADSDARIAAYSALFMAEANFNDGVSSVISAMLQSPYFLYRTELGANGATGATVNLTPNEVANNLSYLLTGTIPDDALLSAADASGTDAASLGKLVDAQAARLLAPSGAEPLSPAAETGLMLMMSHWLGLDRISNHPKDANIQVLTAAQLADMSTETQKLILDVWGSSTNNTASALFSANYTFLNQNLANYYKLSNSGLSASFSKVMLPSGRDPGLLGQGTILLGYSGANRSSPTQRGHLVRSRLMCQSVPPPPPNVNVNFVPRTDLKTTRDQYLEGHASPDHASCYVCHRSMDPIGVAFEHYDEFGNYRTTENGVTIDATGTIYAANGPGSDDVAIDGLSGEKGLSTYLAKNPELSACMIRYWSFYAFGDVTWDQDGCTYDAIGKEAAAQGSSLKSVLLAFLHAPQFTSRVNQ